ncbi:MAG: hypothetical protein FWF86_07955 [Clostridia bacterium]|nr:hypothetical protein [Clostridia bacterium]
MMKKIMSCLLLCALCLAGPGVAFAAPPETDSPGWPDVPFVRNMASGEIIYLGMDKAEAEAITGEPLEEFMGMYAYVGGILGFRDDRVVYIRISIYEEPLWVVSGVVTPGMPTDQALEALGMPFEAGNGPYELLYFEDGDREHRDGNTLWPGRDDYQWALFVRANSETIERIDMGDKQFLQTYK